MPKKHQPNYKPASNYVHPSLSSSRTSASSNAGPSSSQSVNDRLNQLRREQAPRSTQDRWNEITETLTSRAVHPDVRQVLNLPEVGPPRPRLVARTANGRRVPGPAAPQSWLNGSRHAPEYVREVQDQKAERWRIVKPLFAERMPAEGSLVHYTCKTLAKNWLWLLEYEQHYLGTLPIQLKDILLSYLAIYGPDGDITLETLRVLFLSDHELEGATGSDELVHLDLTGMISEKLSLSDLTRYITQAPGPKKEDITAAMHSLAISEDVAESWEEADETEFVPTLPKSLFNSRFPNLTHLSLAHPQKASWPRLLNLSSHLAKLTHLSLSFWPKPCVTPNAAAASIAGPHGRVNLGGTHFYSEMDNDWQEASNILRRLANNTYCLKWLDLSGCDWIPALTWGIDQAETRRPSFRREAEDWDMKQAAPSPNWNGSWGQVTYINVSQGWIPHDVNAIRALPAGILGCELLSFLRSERGKRMVAESPTRNVPQTGSQVRRWIEKEAENRAVSYSLKALRARAKGLYCRFDYGWDDDGVPDFDDDRAW